MVWKLGLDIELRAVAVAIQCGRGVIGLAVKWRREQLLQWVKEKRARGEAVHTVYESCGFGYTLHEQLSAAGANSLVSTPMRLNLERKRKNDRMDARELKEDGVRTKEDGVKSKHLTLALEPARRKEWRGLYA